MIGIDELIGNITDYILLYRQSDDYTKRLLLDVKDDVFVYINDKNTGLLGFDYTQDIHECTKMYNDFDNLYDSLSDECERIPIHITTDFFYVRKNNYNFENLNSQLMYFLDDLGELWEKNENLIISNLLMALKGGLVLNCSIENVILKEYIKNHHIVSNTSSLYDYLPISHLVFNSYILTLYTKNKGFLKNDNLILDSGLCINICNIEKYLDINFNLEFSYPNSKSIVAFKLSNCISQDINEIDKYIDNLAIFLKKYNNIVIDGILINADMFAYDILCESSIYILEKCNQLIASNIIRYNGKIKINTKYVSFKDFKKKYEFYDFLSSYVKKYDVYDTELIDIILKRYSLMTRNG